MEQQVSTLKMKIVFDTLIYQMKGVYLFSDVLKSLFQII